MSTQLPATGLVIKRQSDIISDLEAQWRTTFGANVVLSAQSYNGQIIGIISERMALAYELLEDIYSSQFPSGAEGVSVDNILALNGLKRLPATFAKTDPVAVTQSNGVTLYGLVLTGDAGTVIPQGSQISDNATPAHVFATDADATIKAASNAIQTVLFSNVPNQGTYALKLANQAGQSVTSLPIAYNALPQKTQLVMDGPSGGSYTLTVQGATTAQLQYNSQAQEVAQAIKDATGLQDVIVTGSPAEGMLLELPGIGLRPVSSAGDAAPPVINSVQSAINGKEGTTPGQYPFNDVAVTATALGLVLTYGAVSTKGDQPSVAHQAVPLAQVAYSTLKKDALSTNINIVDTAQGAPSQAIATATATTTGPMDVKANSLTTILNPLTGWSGVNNQLDCISGQDVESDSQALQRRSTLLAAQAQGPLNAVLQRVLEVPGVTQALAFPNLTNAANQLISFEQRPQQGSYALCFGELITQDLSYQAVDSDMQAAIRALTGYDNVSVSGSWAYGYVIDFGGANGGQDVPLAKVVRNTTEVDIDISFGRSPKSVEIVVQGGANKDIAQAIYEASPAGIATYGVPVLATTANTYAGQSQIQPETTQGLYVGLSVRCISIPAGATIVSVDSDSVTLSASALSTYTQAPAVFSNATATADSNGNTVMIAFSRPQPVPIYVRISLVTDRYNKPGDASSGLNVASKWSAAYIPQIQEKIIEIGNKVPIGGTIVAYGSNGLIGAFNDIPGIVDYDLYFGPSTDTTNQNNLQMLSEQVASFQSFNVQVQTL